MDVQQVGMNPLGATKLLLLIVAAGLLAGCGGLRTTTETETVTSVRTVVTQAGGQATTGASGPGTAADGAPDTYAAAKEAIDRGEPMNGMARFVSPSGNFSCDLELDAGVGACELTRVRLKEAPGDSCPPEVEAGIGRLEIINGRVSAVCNSDTIREAPTPPVLPYGRVARANGSGIACLSRAIGMTCIDTAAEVGFFVNTSRYVLFR